MFDELKNMLDIVWGDRQKNRVFLDLAKAELDLLAHRVTAAAEANLRQAERIERLETRLNQLEARTDTY